jgi:hypothetical protein
MDFLLNIKLIQKWFVYIIPKSCFSLNYVFTEDYEHISKQSQTDVRHSEFVTIM